MSARKLTAGPAASAAPLSPGEIIAPDTPAIGSQRGDLTKEHALEPILQ
ncbi:MAG TPA: hypothetical protein VEU33_13215 [Archangium sp.]|nr:hypothetical protein [Archangium sp.]